jgi:hypothetical protein
MRFWGKLNPDMQAFLSKLLQNIINEKIEGSAKFEYASRPLNYWRFDSSNGRNKTPAEIEWSVGNRILRKVNQLLGPESPGEDQLLDQFRHCCDGWKAKIAFGALLQNENP